MTSNNGEMLNTHRDPRRRRLPLPLSASVERNPLPAYAYQGVDGMLRFDIKNPEIRRHAEGGVLPVAIDGGGKGIFDDPRTFLGDTSILMSRNGNIPIASVTKLEKKSSLANSVQQHKQSEVLAGISNWRDTNPFKKEILKKPVSDHQNVSNLDKENFPNIPIPPFSMNDSMHDAELGLEQDNNRSATDEWIHWEKVHQELMGSKNTKGGDHRARVSNMFNEDDFDFAIVLKPSYDYKLWANKLNFRDEITEDDGDEENNVIKEVLGNSYNGSSMMKKDTPNTLRRRKRSTIGMLRGLVDIDDNGNKVFRNRKSVFELAMEAFTPPPGGVNKTSQNLRTPLQRLSDMFSSSNSVTKCLSKTYDPSYSENHSKNCPNTNSDKSERGSMTKRWGNFSAHHSSEKILHLMSPPVKALYRPDIKSSTQKKHPRIDMSNQNLGSSRKDTANKFISSAIPRGFVSHLACSEFLQALQRGVVVRLHKPKSQASFVKIISEDSGDTIKYEPVTFKEASIAIKEQRVRFNKLESNNQPSTPKRSFTCIANTVLPDHVAVQKYREKYSVVRHTIGIISDSAARVLRSGSLKATGILVVHPSVNSDPFEHNYQGTETLRQSLSNYKANKTFSIVTQNSRFLRKKNGAEEWYSGQAPSGSFQTLDIEVDSEGEYWLLVRGFLRLQRDAKNGRLSTHRTAGYGSSTTTNTRLRSSQGSRFEHEQNINRKSSTFSEDKENNARVKKEVVPPPDYFLGFHCAGTQIWGRLRQAGLETKRLYALDKRRVMIKVRCPVDRMHEVAEVLRLKVRKSDGFFVPFRESLFNHSDMNMLQGESGLFRSAMRQVIIDFIIRSRIRDSGAQLGEQSPLGSHITTHLPLHMHSRLEALYYCWVAYWRAENWINRNGDSMSVEKLCITETPTKDKKMKSAMNMPKSSKVPHVIARLFYGALHQPLDSIEEYFGESIAFYAAWVEHVTFHLLFLSLFGVFVFISQLWAWKWDLPIRTFFSIVIMFWSFMVMVTWRKRSNFLAHRWGTLNFKEEETTRPQFHGKYRWCDITKEWVVEYPIWKRILIYTISLPLTIAITLSSLIVVLMLYANRDMLLASYFENDKLYKFKLSISVIGKVTHDIDAHQISPVHLKDINFWIIMFAYPSAVSCFLPVINFLFRVLAVKLNNFENYETESSYRNNLILKVFSFRFVTYFSSLYYYAFLTISTTNSMFRVAASLIIYITVVHWSRVFMSTYVPLLIHRWRVYKERILIRREKRSMQAEIEVTEGKPILTEEQCNQRVLLDQAQSLVWEEVMLPEYDKFDDYMHSVTQFAYVTCFSFVMPLAPLIILINNLITMRLDALKICRGRRRPLAQKTGGLGVWEDVLNLVTVAAVLTNCALVAMTSKEMKLLMSQIGETGFILFIGFWEHIMLLIKYWVTSWTGKLPKSVRDDLKRERYVKSRRRFSINRRTTSSGLEQKFLPRSPYLSPFSKSPFSKSMDKLDELVMKPSISIAAQTLPTGSVGSKKIEDSSLRTSGRNPKDNDLEKAKTTKDMADSFRSIRIPSMKKNENIMDEWLFQQTGVLTSSEASKEVDGSSTNIIDTDNELLREIDSHSEVLSDDFLTDNQISESNHYVKEDIQIDEMHALTDDELSTDLNFDSDTNNELLHEMDSQSEVLSDNYLKENQISKSKHCVKEDTKINEKEPSIHIHPLTDKLSVTNLSFDSKAIAKNDDKGNSTKSTFPKKTEEERTDLMKKRKSILDACTFIKDPSLAEPEKNVVEFFKIYKKQRTRFFSASKLFNEKNKTDLPDLSSQNDSAKSSAICNSERKKSPLVAKKESTKFSVKCKVNSERNKSPMIVKNQSSNSSLIYKVNLERNRSPMVAKKGSSPCHRSTFQIRPLVPFSTFSPKRFKNNKFPPSVKVTSKVGTEGSVSVPFKFGIEKVEGNTPSLKKKQIKFELKASKSLTHPNTTNNILQNKAHLDSKDKNNNIKSPVSFNKENPSPFLKWKKQSNYVPTPFKENMMLNTTRSNSKSSKYPDMLRKRAETQGNHIALQKTGSNLSVTVNDFSKNIESKIGRVRIPDNFTSGKLTYFDPMKHDVYRKYDGDSPICETPQVESVIPPTPPNPFQFLLGDTTPLNVKHLSPFKKRSQFSFLPKK